jgi:transcriptional regulator with XRE-family HTH domain
MKEPTSPAAQTQDELWEKMRNKPYRDSFVEAHLSTNIAAQIQTLREARGWTQMELGKKAGMAQNRISVLEDPSYDKITISTVRRLASAFDVAFIARFIPFSGLVDWVADLSPEKLAVPDFEHDTPLLNSTQTQDALADEILALRDDLRMADLTISGQKLTNAAKDAEIAALDELICLMSQSGYGLPYERFNELRNLMGRARERHLVRAALQPKAADGGER